VNALQATALPSWARFLVTVYWLVIAAVSLVPANNAAFARRVAFPWVRFAGVALAAFGLQAVWLPTHSLTLPLGLPDLPFICASTRSRDFS